MLVLGRGLVVPAGPGNLGLRARADRLQPCILSTQANAAQLPADMGGTHSVSAL